MTDIHQWRRKLQPARSRTPTQPHDSSQRDQNDDAWTGSNPPTPHRRSGATLSTVLSHHQAAPPASKLEPFSTDEWTSIKAPPYQPDISLMAQMIQTKLFKAPHLALPVELNNSVLHIVESYGKLCTENTRLRTELAQEMENSSRAEVRSQEAFKAWSAEENGYKAEIKRLELVVKKWEQGLSDPIQIKQPNVIRRRGRASSLSPNDKPQMLFEFMESSKVDKTSVKPLLEGESKPLRLHSPSTKMTELSKRLSLLGGPQGKLDVGTPPSASMTSILAKTSRMIARERRLGPRATFPGSPDPSSSDYPLSDDNYSNFSSNGDALPDELSEASGTIDLSVDKDFGAVRRLPELMASRWGMKFEDSLPKVVEVFFGNQKQILSQFACIGPSGATDKVSEGSQAWKALQSRGTELQNADKLAPYDGKGNGTTIPGHHPFTVMDSNIQTQQRPFSFYAGDDSSLDIFRMDSPENPTLKRSTALPDSSKKSRASDVSSEKAVINPASPLAAIEESPPPTSSPFPANKTSSDNNSRIPTPSYDPNNVVSKRRETSSSSLGTVIQRSPATSIKQSKNPSLNSLHRISTTTDHDRKSTSAASSSRNSVASFDRTQDPRRSPAEKSSLRSSTVATATAAARAGGAKSSTKVVGETDKTVISSKS